MLILTRKVDESIIIGDNITLTVLSVKGKQIQIGVDAPPDIKVHREEVYDRIRENEAIAKAESA